ncbi:MAG TPA: hypothetical protein VES89_12530 [Candidatus Competibacteraceae bacterium]|nr:hypothetical protein [Candidatus Competibacteraceae bacterium]
MAKRLHAGDIIRLVNPGYGEPDDECTVIADQTTGLVWFTARSGGAAFVARRGAVRLIKRVPPIQESNP